MCCACQGAETLADPVTHAHAARAHHPGAARTLNPACLAPCWVQDDIEVKLLPGDELRLRHKSAGARGVWEGTGHVVGGEGLVCFAL